MTTEPLPADPALPTLATAWNAQVMLQAFRAELRPARGCSCEILACQIERFRYRRKTRAIVLYRLRLRNGGTGAELTDAWVTGILYPGDRGRALAARLAKQAAHANPDQPQPPFAPFQYLTAARMLVQIFPFDRYLEQAPWLVREPTAVVTSALGAQAADGRQLEWTVTPLRYRPLQGLALRYRGEPRIADGQPRTVHAKAYRDATGERTIHLMRMVRADARAERAGFSAAEPLAWSPKLRTLFVAAAPGRSLEELILTGGAHALEAARLTGRTVAALHQSAIAPKSRWTAADAAKRAEAAAALIGWASPELASPAAEVAKLVIVGIDQADICPTHLDMKPDHIFVDGSRICLIDLDTLALSDPVFDVANLLARLATLEGGGVLARHCAEAFLDAYFSNAPAQRQSRLGPHYGFAIMQLALFALRHQEPGWPQKVSAMVAAAGRAARLGTADVAAGALLGALA